MPVISITKGLVELECFTATVLLGMERSRLLGRNLAIFIANDTRPLLVAFLDKVFSSQGKESCEVELTTTGSAPLFVQIEAVVNASEEGPGRDLLLHSGVTLFWRLFSRQI